MRKFALCLPILALSACSALEQPFLQSANGSASGHYNQGCAPVSCVSGQGYSVTSAPHQGLHHQGGYQQSGYHDSAHHHSGHYDGHNVNGGDAAFWPDMNLVPSYEGGGPVHINPTGFRHLGPSGYGAQFRPGYGYGQRPQLRGMYGAKLGHFYGTIGGVMYDTDADSFGIEGRIGYNSGRIFGAEVEGSLGLTDESSVVASAVGPIDVKAGFDYNFAAFGIARLPLSHRLSLHARGGYDFRDITAIGTAQDGTSATISQSLDGLAYGVGAEYALSPRDGLRLDFTRYDNDIGASDSVSASYTRKF